MWTGSLRFRLVIERGRGLVMVLESYKIHVVLVACNMGEVEVRILESNIKRYLQIKI